MNLTKEKIEEWRAKCLSLWMVNCTIEQSHAQANALCDLALKGLAVPEALPNTVICPHCGKGIFLKEINTPPPQGGGDK